MKTASHNFVRLSVLILLVSLTALIVQPARADLPKPEIELTKICGNYMYRPHGIITFFNKQQGYYEAKVVSQGLFHDHATCIAKTKTVSHSDDSVGTGGTDNHVPGLPWNYDNVCLPEFIVVVCQ